MNKYILPLLLFLIAIKVHSQYDKFMLWGWTYEFDNIPSPCATIAGLPGSDPVIGHDYEFIRQLKKTKINGILADRQ